MRAGIPLKPMLAKICEGIPDAISQLRAGGGRFLAEFKYDGVRAQIHLLPDGTVRPRPLRPYSAGCEVLALPQRHYSPAWRQDAGLFAKEAERR